MGVGSTARSRGPWGPLRGAARSWVVRVVRRRALSGFEAMGDVVPPCKNSRAGEGGLFGGCVSVGQERWLVV